MVSRGLKPAKAHGYRHGLALRGRTGGTLPRWSLAPRLAEKSLAASIIVVMLMTT